MKNGLQVGIFRAVWLVLILGATPAVVTAQSLYSAAVTVNGNAVTYFEIQQRARMLEALGTVGDVNKQARKNLVDDKLRLQAARSMGLAVTQDELKTGIEDFAKRTNIDAQQLTDGLAQRGIYQETLEDFVRSGILWRKVIQTKFQGKARLSEAELDTAMALGTTAVGASVLLSELVMPLPQGQEAETIQLAGTIAGRIHSYSDFEEAALTYSAAASRANGGKLDWMPITNLPPEVGKSIMTMSVGAVTAPIQIPNAVAIFQLRGIRDNRAIAAKTIAYDYASLLLDGGKSEATLAQAQKIAGEIDTCGDLQARAENLPEGRFSRVVTPVNKIPRAIRGEISNLDANEVSYTLTRGENNEFLVFLMLCGRTNSLSEGNRQQVRTALFNQRMEAFGTGYLQELKGDAIIIQK